MKEKLKQFLSKIIFKILKKYPDIKENIDEYYKIEKKLQEEQIKRKEKIQAEEEKRKLEEFNKIKPGDIVIAKTPNFRSKDKSHLYRPFFIVGRGEKNLFGLYGTSDPKYKNNEEYYSIKNKNYNTDLGYYCCNNITNISIDEFHSLKEHANRSLCDTVTNKCFSLANNMNKIDFGYFNFEIEPGSILKYKKKYYLVVNCNDDKSYKAIVLKKTDNIDPYKKYISISSNKYEITDEIETFSSEYAKYRLGLIKKQDLNYFKSTFSKIEKNNYIMGDILSLKNSKNKIIFLMQKNNKIYYITEDSLYLFTGISEIDKDEISGLYKGSNDIIIEKISRILENKIESNNKFIDDNIKQDLLRIIRK